MMHHSSTALVLAPLLTSPRGLCWLSADRPQRWHVEVPRTFEGMAEQASRSVLAAARAHSELLVEARTPEFDPDGDYYRPAELVRFAEAIAQPLLTSARAPRVRLLFPSPAEAMPARAMLAANLQVGVLGEPVAGGDSAWICLTPPSDGSALTRLVDEANGRLVIVLNAQTQADNSSDEANAAMSLNAALLATFERAYVMRQLSVAFLQNQLARKITRRRACILRCYPHEFGVLLHTEEEAAQAWRYAGAFSSAPREEQLQALLQDSLTRERNERWKRAGESQ